MNENVIEKRDMILAKRRAFAIMPLSIVQIICASFILIFTKNISNDFHEIENNYKYFEGIVFLENPKSSCQYIIESIKKGEDFYSVFKTFQTKEDELFSIYLTAIILIIIPITFVMFTLCCANTIFCSDEQIRRYTLHESNGIHRNSYCLAVFKSLSFLGLLALNIYFFTLDVALNPFHSTSTFIDFYEDCVSNKNTFRTKFKLCWDIKYNMTGYRIFLVLYLIFDIFSLILLYNSKSHNPWSYCLYKITCGIHHYLGINYSNVQSSTDGINKIRNEKLIPKDKNENKNQSHNNNMTPLNEISGSNNLLDDKEEI